MADALRDRIVLGHNAFFGTNHLSAARGAERAAYFADPRRILGVIHAAHERDVDGIMMSTHERAALVAELIRSDGALKQNFRVYPLLPYLQKYVTRANEVGMLNVIFDMLSGEKMTHKLVAMWQGGKGLVSRDVNRVLSALIRLELLPFRELDVPAVFLHDVFTDLALGLGMRDVFEFYLEEMRTVHRCQGAFATKNLPLLLEKFADWSLPTPVVATHFNKAGFHMNPSRVACEAAVRAREADIMAMGTLASGYLEPDEAYAYLAGIPQVVSVVVGVSSRAHFDETFEAIRRHMNDRARTMPVQGDSLG